MKQQTAVEWLISNLQQSKDWQRVLNEVSQMSTVQFEIIDQAIEMEKEQIENAYWDGGHDVPVNVKKCESYYNEIYGK